MLMLTMKAEKTNPDLMMTLQVKAVDGDRGIGNPITYSIMMTMMLTYSMMMMIITRFSK